MTLRHRRTVDAVDLQEDGHFGRGLARGRAPRPGSAGRTGRTGGTLCTSGTGRAGRTGDASGTSCAVHTISSVHTIGTIGAGRSGRTRRSGDACRTRRAGDVPHDLHLAASAAATVLGDAQVSTRTPTCHHFVARARARRRERHRRDGQQRHGHQTSDRPTRRLLHGLHPPDTVHPDRPDRSPSKSSASIPSTCDKRCSELGRWIVKDERCFTKC